MRNSILLLFVISFLPLDGFADERDLHRDRPRDRGNEHSDRVDHLPRGNLEYQGIGCPAGSAQIIFAPDNTSFSILFDRFIAEVLPNAGRPQSQMICNLSLPMDIPAGKRMKITRVDYRGFVALEAGARAVLRSQYGFNQMRQGDGREGGRDGGANMGLNYQFAGPLTENYFLSSGVVQEQTVISPCGGSTRLTMQNSLKVVTASPTQSAQVTVDSIDGKSNAVYYVNWEACSSDRPGNGDPTRPDRPGRPDRPDRIGPSPGRH